MSILIVHTDGSCMPNPGEMGIGIVIYEESKIIKTISEFIGNGTNNIAEYSAFIRGLEEIKEWKIIGDLVEVHIDSQLIFKQIIGEYKVKKEGLKPLCKRAKKLIKEIGDVKIVWSGRKDNGTADRLAKEAIWLKRTNEREDK